MSKPVQSSETCDKSQGPGILKAKGIVASDTSLIEATLAGDDIAFEHLFKRYKKMIVYICQQYSANDEVLAHDHCQEAFITAYNRLGQLKDPSQFSAWLSEIARNKCRSYSRKQHRLQKALGDYSVVKEAILDNDRQWTEHEIRIVEDIIENLDDQKVKDTIHLYYIEGKKSKEVAEILGISQSLVTTRLNRFRTKFKKRIMLEIFKLREAKE